MSSTSSNGNQSRGTSIGGGLGSAVRGAFETVQGVGNNIRGNAMDFVDSATGTGPRHSTEADIGRRQTEEGVQRMEAGSHGVANPSSAASTTTTGTGTTGHTPTATTTAQPPLPPRNAHGTLEGNGEGVGGQTRSNV